MKLIVGLGNPGRIYANSRHNIGSLVVKALAKSYRIALKKEKKISSLSGKGKIEGEDVIFAIPLTFMNLSGTAVRALLEKYNLGIDELLVVCDDFDLDLGRLRIKSRGSSGGHRGLKSIIDSLGSQDFGRLRLGIGRPSKNMEPPDYVLANFRKSERKEIKEIIEKASGCCKTWIIEGIGESMNIFNRWSG